MEARCPRPIVKASRATARRFPHVCRPACRSCPAGGLARPCGIGFRQPRRFVEMPRFIGDPFWTSYVLESDTACKIAELYHTGGAHRNRGSEPGQRKMIMSYRSE